MTDQNQAPERIWTTGDRQSGSWNNEPASNRRIDLGEVEYVRSDLLEAAESRAEKAGAERDQLAEQYARSCVAIERIAAQRDHVLAASAAREIAMRDRAAVITASKYGKENISTIPLSPDGQQALNEMLAKAWDEGFEKAWIYDDYAKNPYRRG